MSTIVKVMILAAVLLIGGRVLAVEAQAAPVGYGSQAPTTTECSDNDDNDDDGLFDEEDRGCDGPEDDSEAPYDIPDLTLSEAKRYMRVALNRRFGGSYKHADGKRLRGCKKLSRLRRSCVASWYIGDVGYRGKITIWYSRAAGGAEWNYAYTIRMTNYYCVDRKQDGEPAFQGRSCVKTYRVTYRVGAFRHEDDAITWIRAFLDSGRAKGPHRYGNAHYALNDEHLVPFVVQTFNVPEHDVKRQLEAFVADRGGHVREDVVGGADDEIPPREDRPAARRLRTYMIPVGDD